MISYIYMNMSIHKKSQILVRLLPKQEYTGIFDHFVMNIL